MKTNKNALSIVLSVSALTIYCIFLLGSAVAPPAPPVAEYFIFNPPSTTAPTKSKISIAILSPTTIGNFFVNEAQMASDAKLSISRMASSMQTDLEKIIIAKGYTTAGTFSSIDEMTYSQKERASFILRPIINLDLNVQREQGTMSGNVTLELMEPMSKEKIWIKRLNLDPIIGPISYEFANVQTPPDMRLRLVQIISTNSVRKLLNDFYMPAMGKIWDHFDPREINNLKSDSDKLKGKTQYQGK
ncbi:MAG: hypothetical protein Q7T35_00685 [Nitrosomonas sp.]|nr:hypothetical protein [Nitrosomonas sp.]